MKIGGLQKLTLIDYPGKIATTIFTVGCSFRCPFCHNPELVIPSYGQTGSITEKDFFDFLKKRKGKLDGVCITGGEPTIQKDLLKFVRRVKKMGYLIKLDSNGTRPDVLKKGLKEGLFDFIAMDIKNSLENYDRASGCKTDIDRVKLSVDLIRNSGIDYEFRTTVVPGIHHYKDFEKIAKWLKGSKKYVLQEYRNEGKILSQEFISKNYKKVLDFEKIKKRIEKFFDKVEVH
ncbi:MAG: anaerobic ribonucleoside-triphosphate reductase activating protein [Patescibacteria group bacterium]|jgi:pyruvate formate lyase activating enzyme|nr:anaerobic ribonucleoside-triphosphate reductase activating protein [Patescibacteria group bacterium]